MENGQAHVYKNKTLNEINLNMEEELGELEGLAVDSITNITDMENAVRCTSFEESVMTRLRLYRLLHLLINH